MPCILQVTELSCPSSTATHAVHSLSRQTDNNSSLADHAAQVGFHARSLLICCSLHDLLACCGSNWCSQMSFQGISAIPWAPLRINAGRLWTSTTAATKMSGRTISQSMLRSRMGSCCLPWMISPQAVGLKALSIRGISCSPKLQPQLLSIYLYRPCL